MAYVRHGQGWVAHGTGEPPNSVLRPRNAARVYAHPGPEFARLAEAGLLLRVAHG